MRTRVQLGDIATATVIDRRPDRTERARIRDNAPHAYYAVEREDIRAELGAFAAVCESIARFVEVPVPSRWTVWEPFGGSGWHTALIQSIVQPHCHVASDINQDCVDSIKASNPGWRTSVRAHREDSLGKLAARSQLGIDWIHADFNLWTLDHLAKDERLRHAFHGMFGTALQLVTFTDTTPYTLPGGTSDHATMAVRDSAEAEWFGELDRWLGALFGWSIHATFKWGPAAMHLCRPSPVSGFRVVNGPYNPMPVTILEQMED
jgi:hypothetical protein